MVPLVLVVVVVVAVRVSQTSNTQYSALDSTKAHLASHANSDFEYSLLCFGRAQMPMCKLD